MLCCNVSSAVSRRCLPASHAQAPIIHIHSPAAIFRFAADVYQLCERLGYTHLQCPCSNLNQRCSVKEVDPLNFMPTVNRVCVPGECCPHPPRHEPFARPLSMRAPLHMLSLPAMLLEFRAHDSLSQIRTALNCFAVIWNHVQGKPPRTCSVTQLMLLQLPE